MQFHGVELLRTDASGLVNLIGGGARHVIADQLHHVARLERARCVGGHRLRQDAHSVIESVGPGEGFGADDGRRRAAGRRAGHQAGHWADQHRGVHHFLHCHFLAEQRHRVARGMPARLSAYFGEGLRLGAVLVHVRHARAAKIADRQRHLGLSHQLLADPVKGFEGGRPVVVVAAQRSRLHLLEAQGDHAVGGAGLHRLARQEQGGRAGGTIVVDVDHGNAGHADWIERSLAAGGIAVDIAHVGLLHLGVVQPGIGQGLTRRLGTHLVVGRAGAGFRERHHADAADHRCVFHAFLLTL